MSRPSWPQRVFLAVGNAFVVSAVLVFTLSVFDLATFAVNGVLAGVLSLLVTLAVVVLVFMVSRDRDRERRLLLGRLARLSASSLTDLATMLPGRRRLALRDEWRAHLAGESGHAPVTWRKTREALGFVAAAIQFRLADAADLAWRPADAVLKSRTKSNLFAWLPVLGIVLTVVHHDGWYGPIANAENLIETWVGLYTAVRVGRWYRKVKPPDPRPRHAGMATAGEDGQEDTPKG